VEVITGALTDGNTEQSAHRDLNTVPALFGILFAVAAAVQFLGATISVAPTADLSYTLEGTHAVGLSLVSLLVAFASSDTRSFEHYETWEQGAVALGALAIIGTEYVTEISDFLANNQPYTGLAMFAIGMMAWGILSR